ALNAPDSAWRDVSQGFPRASSRRGNRPLRFGLGSRALMRLNPHRPMKDPIMIARSFAVGLQLSALVFFGPPILAQSRSTTSMQTLYYIPHTHWEGAVFK